MDWFCRPRDSSNLHSSSFKRTKEHSSEKSTVTHTQTHTDTHTHTHVPGKLLTRLLPMERHRAFSPNPEISPTIVRQQFNNGDGGIRECFQIFGRPKIRQVGEGSVSQQPVRQSRALGLFDLSARRLAVSCPKYHSSCKLCGSHYGALKSGAMFTSYSEIPTLTRMRGPASCRQYRRPQKLSRGSSGLGLLKPQLRPWSLN